MCVFEKESLLSGCIVLDVNPFHLANEEPVLGSQRSQIVCWVVDGSCGCRWYIRWQEEESDEKWVGLAARVAQGSE